MSAHVPSGFVLIDSSQMPPSNMRKTVCDPDSDDDQVPDIEVIGTGNSSGTRTTRRYVAYREPAAKKRRLTTSQPPSMTADSVSPEDPKEDGPWKPKKVCLIDIYPSWQRLSSSNREHRSS